MLSCFSKKHILKMNSGAFLALLLVACQKPAEVRTSRVYLDELALSAQRGAVMAESGGTRDEASYFTEESSPDAELGACALIESLGEPLAGDDQFRMLVDMHLNKPEVLKMHEEDSEEELTRKKAVHIELAHGRVDIASNPTFQYALSRETLPSKKEFYDMIDEELKFPPLKFVSVLLFRTALRTKILEVFKQRNRIVTNHMNKALPGLFDSKGKVYPLKDTLPFILMVNGTPAASNLASKRREKNKSIEAKEVALKNLYSIYSKSIPLMPETWSVFQSQMRNNMGGILKAYNSKDAEEQACATLLLHRHLAQLLNTVGYDKLPTQNNETNQTSYLPKVDELLESRDGDSFRVCSSPGSFVQNGLAIKLSENDIATYTIQKPSYDLSAKPQHSTSCDTPETGVQKRADNLASGTDLSAFLNGLTHMQMALSPANPQWSRSSSQVSYPLGKIDNIPLMKKTKAFMPLEAHALTLGLMNLSVASLFQKHLVFVDRNLVVRNSDDSRVSGFRISEAPIHKGNTLPEDIHTTLVAATHIAELAFKVSSSLARLAVWYEKQKEDIELAGLFGGKQTLEDLISSGPGSVRDKLEKLKLASALLLARFAQDSETGLPTTCYKELVLSTQTHKEVGVGSCSEEEEKNWKYVLRLIGERYESPIFLELGAAGQ